MIIRTETDCILSGTVPKQGGKMLYVGNTKTPVYKFSVIYDGYKDESGRWIGKFMECEFCGTSIEFAPKLTGHERVFCSGRIRKRDFVTRHGEAKSIEVLHCDICFKVSQSTEPRDDLFDQMDRAMLERMNEASGEDFAPNPLEEA